MRTLIIGGGLSGLAVAEALEAQGHDYLLVEARGRFGGRIKTEVHEAGYFDMGPAWFWQGQPRIAALIERLGLEPFEQFVDGHQTFEDALGRVRQGQGFAAMRGSLRLTGGLARLTQTLADRLPAARKILNASALSLTKTDSGVSATLADGRRLDADQFVLAMPPRVAAQMTFAPPLPQGTTQSMLGIPTWMAGQAKAVAVYDRPFWRDAGVSGDATSRRGPMVEIHDASPRDGGPYALFGFIGIAPKDRKDAQALRRDLLAQFGRLFGPEALTPFKLHIEDWATQPHTATEADAAPLSVHPTYGLPSAMTDVWQGRLHFAGTEVAPQFGGFIEGALEAAEVVLKNLQSKRP